ncbi:DUF1330 domain-containing protein [Ramlibacter montanisoli]|uniref:DUF1330 domain-containing protein n=1 Tax=Ramlibacter montanisoli TaxID=2732512 RepID=A0A849K1W0_9BURK|nr:DUF1330 domain-containing protein [Ramlibacter montanisoli]NNU42472.1 DUF1330 domain-containing protein [Ramlibacter montanisoli]
MPAAYLIVEMNISNPEQYKEYMARAPQAVKAAGGEYLVRGGKHETLEGDWQPHRVAMLRFPSYEQAKAFYDGEMYTQARSFRQGATEYFNMVLVEGVAAPV